MLDGMDVMLYAFALTAIQKEFAITSAAAGLMASLPLITAAVGGAVAGILADRYGRTRMLIYSMLLYSVFTGLTATSQTIIQLAIWRSLVGLGLGAEWSAGTVLVAETWPSHNRGKAIAFVQSGWAIGYILAALLAAAIIPVWGWRTLFLIGTFPALVTLWIRRAVPEPKIWRKPAANERLPLGQLLRPPLVGRVVAGVAVCSCVLFAYWGLFTWIPTYLASPASKGGAGLGLLKSSAWIVPVQIGAFCGYNLFGFLSDRIGRRPIFCIFVLGAAAVVPFYGMASNHPNLLLALGPLIGFFGHGYYAVFGAMLAELFPSRIRGSAQGICYNGGRVASAAAPFTIGAIADSHGLGAALACTSLFFAMAGGLIFLLPETKGDDLP